MTSRRVILKTVGAGIALSGTFTGKIAASDDTAGNDHTFIEQLITVLSSTHKYQSVCAAKADGYEEFGVEPPVGHIYQKSDFFNKEEFIGPTKLTEPPALLFYAPVNGTGNSVDPDLTLAGVEYHASGDRTSDPPNLFDDESTSHEFKVTEEEGWHRSPTPEVLDVTGLHVWVHLHNPEGLFHSGNPIIEHLISN